MRTFLDEGHQQLALRRFPVLKESHEGSTLHFVIEYSIFYSWQTDSPDAFNKAFIGERLRHAIEELRNVKQEPIPRFDTDMRGVAGSPDVPTMMFEKISGSAIFIGDVSLVGRVDYERMGQSEPELPKLYPNPNVSVEMGFAAGRLGWERIVGVSNDIYGKPDRLPVDFRSRRHPIRYSLGPESNDCDAQARQLTKDLVDAIKAVQKADLRRVADSLGKLDYPSLTVLLQFQKGDCISESLDQMMTVHGHILSRAIPRLLDLHLIETDVATNSNAYAYHLSFLGRELLSRFPNKQDSPQKQLDLAKEMTEQLA